MYRYVVFLALSSLFVSGCATLSKPEKKSATSDIRFLKSDTVPDIKWKSEDLRDDLTRTGYITWNGSTSVSVMLQTTALEKLYAMQGVEDRAYKEKWDDKKVKSELAKRLKDAEDKYAKKTCFSLSIVSSSFLAAMDSKSWHGKLVVGGEEITLNIPKFEGYSHSLTEKTYSRQYGYRESTTTTYTAGSAVCIDKKIDVTKTMTMTIEPRYEKDLKLVVLTWVDPTIKPEVPAEPETKGMKRWERF